MSGILTRTANGLVQVCHVPASDMTIHMMAWFVCMFLCNDVLFVYSIVWLILHYYFLISGIEGSVDGGTLLEVRRLQYRR